MKRKGTAKPADAESQPYPAWTPPASAGETRQPPPALKVPCTPRLTELKEQALGTQTIPLIDTTTKNYLPRLDYTVFIDGDEEISSCLI